MDVFLCDVSGNLSTTDCISPGSGVCQSAANAANNLNPSTSSKGDSTISEFEKRPDSAGAAMIPGSSSSSLTSANRMHEIQDGDDQNEDSDDSGNSDSTDDAELVNIINLAGGLKDF